MSGLDNDLPTVRSVLGRFVVKSHELQCWWNWIGQLRLGNESLSPDFPFAQPRTERLVILACFKSDCDLGVVG